MGRRLRYWPGVIAKALQLPVHVPVQGDYGAAFGAARLGLIADMGQAPSVICTEPTIAETIDPVVAMADAFEQAFDGYRALYPLVVKLSQ